jgi:hypothetical protein
LFKNIAEVELQGDPRCTEKWVASEANGEQSFNGARAGLDAPRLSAPFEETGIRFLRQIVKGGITEQRERALLLARHAIKHA